MAGSLGEQIRQSPLPYDAERAAEVARDFADLPEAARTLLSHSASCSGYLARLIAKHDDWLRAALEQSPEDGFAGILAEMPASSTSTLGTSLRIAKQRAALLIALADLGGVWSLDQVTGALTDLADRAVQLSLASLIEAEIARGKLPGVTVDDIPDAAGMFVLAMGKMGGHELNYSSDIDLIVLFDETRHDPDDYATLRKGFIRVTQRMVKLLSEITGEGYVFRTDLRLRPDPSVTPVCIATEPAETYYESLGRTWERAAYIKARPCAGAIKAGQSFLDRLSPFIWRRHLDYAAIEDTQDIWRRIQSHKGLDGPLSIPGHNIKLGLGGIREIEFFTQTRQLILGGRNPTLRGSQTLPMLAQMAQDDWISQTDCDVLTEAYISHRTLEHRLQMLEDAQTQEMPTNEEGMARLAAFCGASDVAGFQNNLLSRLKTVRAQTSKAFGAGGTSTNGTCDPQEVFSDPDAAEKLIEGWRRLPALRTQRAQGIFKRIEPDLLRRMSFAHDPDHALRSFDAFLSRLPGGVQLFSMLDANPRLLNLLVDVSGTTHRLIRYLGDNPRLLEAVVSPDFFDPIPGVSALRDELAATLDTATDYEEALQKVRVWNNEYHFRVGVHLLRGIAGAEETETAYSAIAEATLQAFLPVITDHFAERYGPPPGRGAALLAMGKLGSREMTATSDLDVIVIYDAQGAESSEGPRPMATSAYFSRLTQAIINALTAQMREGVVYSVDMRLRPSGRQGPVATSLASFANYQRDQAWTWEHLALTRARAIAGHPELLGEIEQTIAEELAKPRDAAKVLADVREMRTRLAEAKEKDARNPWEAKLGPGRMLDIELLAQTGALLNGLTRARRPRRMLDKLGRTGWLAADDAATLIRSLERLNALQHVGRLASDKTIAPADGGRGLIRLVLDTTDAPDLDTLREDLADAAFESDQIIARRLAEP